MVTAQGVIIFVINICNYILRNSQFWTQHYVWFCKAIAPSTWFQISNENHPQHWTCLTNQNIRVFFLLAWLGRLALDVCVLDASRAGACGVTKSSTLFLMSFFPFVDAHLIFIAFNSLVNVNLMHWFVVSDDLRYVCCYPVVQELVWIASLWW